MILPLSLPSSDTKRRLTNIDMETAAPTPTQASNRPSYTCIRCSERKVRCDRQHPCNTCVKHNVDCVYRPLPTPRKRQKRIKDDVLKDRLKRYEVLLQEQGIDPTQIQDSPPNEKESESSHSKFAGEDSTHQLPTPASTSSEARRNLTKTQLLQGQERSTFVNNSLWTRLVEEIPDPEGVWEDEEASDAETSEHDLAFVVGVDSRSRELTHPTCQHILQLWEIFAENVDPLTKIVHVPSLRPAIQKAANNIENVPKHFEALMFAIYSMAVVSLRDVECKQEFGEARKPLLSRFVADTKRALSRADFMGTTNLVVLQALVLHIFSIRDFYEPRIVWNLTGVAARIAEGMGLDRYGITLGLPTFETEIRQRVWWQLKMHEIRATELNGLAKFRTVESDFHMSRLPANVNDEDVWPGMTSLPVESAATTDMVFCLLRCEMGSNAARITSSARQQGAKAFSLDDYVTQSDAIFRGSFLTEMEELLETKYIRFCDPSEPLQLFAMLFARTVINVGRFLAHHPRRWTDLEHVPEAEREMVWNTSLKLLEQQDMLQSTRQLQRFAWHIPYYLHWHAFIHILDTLRADPLNKDAEKAWKLIEITYENNLDMLLNTKKVLHVAVGNLCLKAFDTRQAALPSQRSGKNIPDYIQRLRSQREAAKARRQVRAAKRRRPGSSINNQQSDRQETENSADSDVTLVEAPRDHAEPYQCPGADLVATDAANGNVDIGNFWLANDIGDGLFGTSNHTTNMDTDFMLAQNFDTESDFDQPIDWSQWGAWLA